MWVASKAAKAGQTDMPKKGHYAVNVPFCTVLQADDGPPGVVNGVIRTEAELKKALKALSPVLRGSVDFAKDQLIYVTLGQRNLDAPEAQIYKITVLDRATPVPLITVSYREIRNILPDDKNEPRFLIHVVKLKNLRGDIEFYKDKKD